MTTVMEAFDAMGMALKDDETVCVVTEINGRYIEKSLEDVADEPIGKNRYFSTGAFAKGQKWGRGGRTLKNVKRILELPFDFDLKDFLRCDKDDLFDMTDEELESYIPLLQRAVENTFSRLGLPIHRLDYTGYGLSAHILLPPHKEEAVQSIKDWHAAIVNRINGLFGDVLADAQVKDAGPRIMRLVPCENVGIRKGGSYVEVARRSRNLYMKDGYIDQAKLEAAAGAISWKGVHVEIPLTGDVLTEDQAQQIVDAYKPYHTHGQKHFMGLAVSGQLAKARIPEDQALAIVTAIAADDNKPWDRQKAVRDTYERVRNGQDVVGFYALKNLVPEDVIAPVDDMLTKIRKAREPKLIFMNDRKKGAFDEGDVKSFNPPPVPPLAFYGWHRDWLDLVYPTTAAAEAFHLAASTTFQAAMMGRRISIEYAGSTLYPNQYTFVIGRTKSYKDTAYRRTMEMLDNARKAASSQQSLTSPPFKPEQDFASREALIETLHNTPNVYLFSTEVTTLLKNATREGTSTLLDALIQAWDNPAEMSTNSLRARKEQSGSAANTYLCIYGGSQPGRIADHMTETMITSGLGNRVAFFMGVKRGNLSQTPRMDFDESVRMYHRLRQAINWYEEGSELKMSPAASKMWDEWFDAIPEYDDEIASDISVRHPEMAQKWALMFAVSDQADRVEAHHLESALILVNWMWECVQTMLPSWGVSNERKIEERIITVLQQRQPMTRRDLNRYVRGRWTAREFATVFRAMKDNQQIVVDSSDRYVALTEDVMSERGIA